MPSMHVFYDSVANGAEELEMGEPVLPRYRKAHGGMMMEHHMFSSGFSDPRSFFRQKYFEACDLLIQARNCMHDHFGQREVLLP